MLRRGIYLFSIFYQRYRRKCRNCRKFWFSLLMLGIWINSRRPWRPIGLARATRLSHPAEVRPVPASAKWPASPATSGAHERTQQARQKEKYDKQEYKEDDHHGCCPQEPKYQGKAQAEDNGNQQLPGQGGPLKRHGLLPFMMRGSC